MNLNFFGLRQTPFGDIDSSSLSWTAKRRELAALFRRALVDQQAILVLTGEEGSGKTAFIRAVLDGFAEQKFKVISMSSEKLSFPTLLKTVIHELGGTVEQQNPVPNVLPTPKKPAHPMAPLEEIAPLMHALHAALLANHDQQGNTVVLVIDHAHHLPVKAIKDCHWLSMLETPQGKLIQTIFVGNTTLSLKLEMPQLQLFKQRIAIHGELTPLSPEESFVYLLARLNAKHGPRTSSPLFSVEALRLLARHGKGNPRFLNTLANAALRTGATRRQKPISGPLMLEVIGEFRTLPMINRSAARIQLTHPPIRSRRTVPRPNARQLWAAGVGAAAAALVLFFYQHAVTNGGNSMLPNLVRLLRNAMVAQAAPDAEPVAPVPALVENRSPTLEFVPPVPLTNSDPSEKHRNFTKEKKRTETRSVARSPSLQPQSNSLGEPRDSLSEEVPPLDLSKDVVLPDLPLPGKILYRIPLDPASNKDRLFDK